MKLLIFAQTVDKNDPVLGFFHHWIEVFSKNYEKVTVVCLYKGVIELPVNVEVFSLGKEEGPSRLKYIARFYTYVLKFRNNYDSVFVHMNQEYILLGGFLWKLMGKHVYMWRNHHSGSFLTDIAASFCTNVFCTSKYSYTAKYPKTRFMPVGIDVDIFKRLPSIQKDRNLLFLGRITPSKKPHVLIEAVKMLHEQGIKATASIYGNALPQDQAYYDSLSAKTREYHVQEHVSFKKGIPNSEAFAVYNAHEIFVNLSSSGMYDKTIFEAMACESLSIASNNNLKGEIDDCFIFEEDNASELARKLTTLLAMGPDEKADQGKKLRAYVLEKHSLTKLSALLAQHIT